MIPNTSTRQVQSVRTAFRIVGILQDMDGVTMNELASQLDLAKSTVHNYLGTLQSLGYAVEHEGTYRLGLRFLTHGMAAKSGLGLRDTVGHILPQIASDLGHSTWWIVEELGRGIFAEKATPESGQPTYGRIGKRSYLHTHAPGKAMLAELPGEYVEELVAYHGLPVYTKETITDPEALQSELADVREQGYAVSDGEAALGIRSVGVAFEGPYGYTHGLGIFGYSHDFGTNAEHDIPGRLQAAVDTIEQSGLEEVTR
ncbi:MAG: DNA-binding IclR family transcriptional regulator [Haloarculaceae archaeon]|jgi:DNA-binding IclR family transcriptional regulator